LTRTLSFPKGTKIRRKRAEGSRKLSQQKKKTLTPGSTKQVERRGPLEKKT